MENKIIVKDNQGNDITIEIITTFNLKELKSQDDEVLYFIEFDIDELIEYLTSNKDTINGMTPEGEKTFNRNEFIQAYIEDDQLYLKYLNLAKQVANKEQNISWENFQ